MLFKTLVDKIDQMDLTRTITNNHKRLYEVNQSTSNINEDIKQMSIAFCNINELNQNDPEQFEGTICNVLNGINNTYDKKNFKGRPKFALFCSYCSSHGHTEGRCFKRPRRESIARPKEKSFSSHMRNNQNLQNRRIYSNNINGRQLPSTSPIYNNSRSRTPYRSKSRNNYNIKNNTILEIIEIIKDIGDQTTTITEVPVITETIIVETEVTVTIEIITITDTTIVDQVQDIQTETIQDNSHHITKIIVIIAIIDKDTTAEILVETTNIDNVLIVTTDITQTIITRMTAEIKYKTL